MSTAVITGATAGLGLEFVRCVEEFFPEVDRVWLVARSEDKLHEASALLRRCSVRLLPLDLCSPDALTEFGKALEEEAPSLSLLVNNAGCGVLGNVGEGDWTAHTRMIDLNLRALTAVTALSVPYLARGGHIVNMSSIASFCPNPRMTVYSAGKSYVSAFSRGLGAELKDKGVSVTAVCSGPMDTPFLETAGIKGNSKTFDTLPYCDPVKVARGAYAAAKKGRAVYTPRGFYKLYRVLAKVLPQRLMIHFTKT